MDFERGRAEEDGVCGRRACEDDRDELGLSAFSAPGTATFLFGAEPEVTLARARRSDAEIMLFSLGVGGTKDEDGDMMSSGEAGAICRVYRFPAPSMVDGGLLLFTAFSLAETGREEDMADPASLEPHRGDAGGFKVS